MKVIQYTVKGDPRTKKNSQTIAGSGRRCPTCRKQVKIPAVPPARRDCPASRGGLRSFDPTAADIPSAQRRNSGAVGISHYRAAFFSAARPFSAQADPPGRTARLEVHRRSLPQSSASRRLSRADADGDRKTRRLGASAHAAARTAPPKARQIPRQNGSAPALSAYGRHGRWRDSRLPPKDLSFRWHSRRRAD